ncbi:serine/threonine-protein kinase [Streptomyces maremycinicus]|uniref:serine/threonine-protein kinase n=1 Tax=Streptomyces maremycinicus TaxID=1679753 RepID=UPI0007876C98|nr:serine/threonine-protein kinase [Streptomyces sp. NBRC 110468]
MPVNIPERVGPYRPVRHLGTGGMGAVYYATDPDGGAPLAVKVLHQDFAADPAHRARFRRETAMLRKVTGPYLVPLVAADPDAPLPWLATAYVHGNTLHQHVRDTGPLRSDNLLTFAAAVAHALACIHDAGVAHRDLKPTNVLLAADGPRVVDFGIAHHLDATAITATSVTTGTPGWMAPEQLTDGTTLPACDIFAWGLLVAYAAAAVHPFGAPTGITHRIVSAEPSLQGVPDVLLPLVRDALRKAPGKRPSAAEIAERAAAAYGPTGTAVFPTMSYTRPLEHGAGAGAGAVPGPGRSEAEAQAEAHGTVSLERASWDVPLPVEDHSDEGAVGAAPADPPAASEEPPPSRTSGEPTSQATAQKERAVPPAPPAPPAPPVPPVPPVPAAPVPVSPPSSEASPGKRRTRRRVVVGAVAATVVLGAGGMAVGLMAGDDETRTPARDIAASTTAGSEAATPSQDATTAAPSVDGSPNADEVVAEQEEEQEPEPVAVFGGLRVTVPAGSELEYRSGDADADSEAVWDTPQEPTVATGADFSLQGDPDTGVRVLYSPELTLDEIREGQSGTGAMWSTASEDGMTTTDESVISVKDGPLTDIGGKKARSWTFGTDVLPDYDGSRKDSHRVWWLSSSRYLLYTYGNHDKTTDAMVDALIKGIGFEATKMPRDCADAVVALDKAAADGEPADDHGALANCQGAAVYGAEQLDPGTVDTEGEAACVALAVAYGGYGGADFTYDEAKAYKELRPWCDVPGAVRNPRLPHY